MEGEQNTENNRNKKKSAENFRFGKVIGEGSFSTVFLAKEIDNGKEYASKFAAEVRESFSDV